MMPFKRIVHAIGFLGFVCLFGWEAWAVHEGGRLRVLPEESRVEFVASYSFVSHHLNIGGEMQGLLKIRSGDSNMNIVDPAKGKPVEIVIDARSMDTGNRWRDTRIKNEYLEVEKFSEIRFRLTRVEGIHGLRDIGEGSNRTVEGWLTLHGVTRRIMTKARLANRDRRIMVDGETTVPMSRFGMKLPKAPPFLTGRDDVKVKFHIVLEGH